MSNVYANMISQLQSELNSIENVPPKGFRRNVLVYELISSVNNITGCFLSNNFDPIPVLISRARVFMENNEGLDGSQEYYGLVNSYLSAMEEWIEGNGI